MPPSSLSHLTYTVVDICLDGQNAFNFYGTKLCQECSAPLPLSEGISKGKATHAVIHVLSFRWTITLISDRFFWCPEQQKKVNSEHKAVKDLQCTALINKGLYQLRAHDWCVNISAVTQSGTRRRVTPLFTEHKDHKQVLATSASPSVKEWAFQIIHGLSKDLNGDQDRAARFHFGDFLRNQRRNIFTWAKVKSCCRINKL